MKNLIRFGALFIIAGVLSVPAFGQKNAKKLSGTVIYSVESVGKSPIPINKPEQIVKVLENKLINEEKTILIKDKTIYSILDFSPIQGYIQSAGVEFDYEGPWKAYHINVISQADIDSLNSSEEYKIEYLPETKEIAGIKAKKATVSIQMAEEKKVLEVWYTEEMGPDYDFAFVYGLKGFPLEYERIVGNDMVVKLTVKEFKKGKVKDVDFLLPAGFEEISTEKYQDFMQKYQELVESMQ